MSNSVNSTPGSPRIIQINTPGPQGPQGPAGSVTGSLSGDIVALNITASGNISASGYIQSNEYYLQQAKVLFAEDGKVKVGNTVTGTVIEGTSLVLNSDTQITGSLIVSGASNSVFDIDFFDLIITGGLDVSRDVVVRDDLTVYDDANLRGTECNIGYGDDNPGFGYTLFVTQSSTNVSGAAFIDGDITVASGVISSSLVSTNYSLTAYSASFFYISASHLDLDSSSLSIGGEPWTQADVVSLKAGKSLRQDQKQIVNENDTSTFVRMSSAGKAWHYASNKPLIKLQTSSFDLGSTDIPMTIEGSSLVVTGSTEISGSCVVSGSFTVTDLLSVLADYGQTGSMSVSGSSEFIGDVNMDGNVNVQDLLTVLAGMNVSGSTTITGSCEISGSNEPGSPPALIITGSTEITGSCIIDGPTTITDVLNVIGNYGQTGSLGVSGSTNLVGDLNCDGQVNVQDLLIATAGLQVTGSCTISEGPFTVDTLLTILSSMSQTGSYDIQGDLNCDGVVSTADLLIALGGMQAGGDSEISGSLVISGSNSLTPTVEITGSLDCSGSVNVNGPFTVTDVLTVLADYGQTGSFSVSGSTWLDGDINLDGQVNVQDLLLVLSGLGNTSGSNVECSGSIDEAYDNDMYLYQSALSSAFPNDAMFNQLKVKSGSSYSQNFDPIVNYTGSGTIDFELPALSSIGLGVSYHILNRHNILHQQNVTMSISPASTDKFLYLPNGTAGTIDKSLLSYTPTDIGQGSPFIKFTYGNSEGWSITELGGTWEQEA